MKLPFPFRSGNNGNNRDKCGIYAVVKYHRFVVKYNRSVVGYNRLWFGTPKRLAYFVCLPMQAGLNDTMMQAADVTHWASCPINLSPKQIREPLSVFRDFFSDDSLPGHLEHLREWRACVLADDFYRDRKGSPAGLLYFYKLNVCLVEAAFLLSDTRAIPPFHFFRKAGECDLPASSFLKKDEISKPVAVLRGLFESYELSWYRRQLWDWLEYGLSAKAAGEFIDTADLVFLYETLQRLYEAACLFCRGAGYQDILFHGHADSPVNAEPDNTDKPCVRLYELDAAVSPRDRDQFSSIVSTIKHKLPSAVAVFYLGKRPGIGDTIYLLVLTADSEQGEALALGTMLEESCRPFDVAVLVHYASVVMNAAGTGDRFFAHAISCPVLYLSGDLLLPNTKCSGASAHLDLNEAYWFRWNKQANEFLMGAEYYLSAQAYSAALFSLHQAAECILIAIVRAVLGYRMNSHNLSRLLKVTQMFTGDLAGVFALNTEQGRLQFQLLKDAYIGVRYRDTFEPDTKWVETLYPIIKQLVINTECIWLKYTRCSVL